MDTMLAPFTVTEIGSLQPNVNTAGGNVAVSVTSGNNVNGFANGDWEVNGNGGSNGNGHSGSYNGHGHNASALHSNRNRGQRRGGNRNGNAGSDGAAGTGVPSGTSR